MKKSTLFVSTLALAVASFTSLTAWANIEPATTSQNTVQAQPDLAIVQTTQGKVQGYIRNGIYTYHGIPYAQATERFVPAQKVPAWDGVKTAFRYGAISPQADTPEAFASTWETPAYRFAQDNNAQNLNIWTPATDNKKRPVMIWLHGGGFSSGSSAFLPSYDGANLSRKGDVVVVSINHRLNVLGHLDLSAYGEKYKNSANVGVLDMISALEWVKENIAQFGGDPDNITPFGESGGGAKILALMTTPKAKGLFHKGIVQSGAVETMGVQFNSKQASQRATELTLKELNITPENIEALQSLPYERLVSASEKALAQTAEELKMPAPLFGGFAMNWQPVVDGDFMPSNPVTEQGFAENAQDIPLLIGSNLAEWQGISMLMNPDQAQNDSPQTWSSEETEKRLTAQYGEQKEQIVSEFLQAYPDKSRGDAMFIDSQVIRLPLLKIMSHKAKQKAPVYSYVFSWQSPLLNGVNISHHTAEIPFVFNNLDKVDTVTGNGKEALDLQHKMSQAWINFARTGNPSHSDIPEWQAYNPENGATMIFDNKVRLTHHHDQKLMKLLAPEYQW